MYRVIVKNNGTETLLNNSELMNVRVTGIINKSDSFSFDCTNGIDIALFNPFKTIVTVFDEEDIIFKGRIINVEKDVYDIRTITCEGTLAYLNDSIYPPFEWKGSLKDLLQDVLNNHNSLVDNEKKIFLGEVTVNDPNDYLPRKSENYTSSLQLISEKLINSLGGYLVLRYEGTDTYLDWLNGIDHVNSQVIELGSNLMDLNIEYAYDDVITRLIPLGAVDSNTNKRVDITTVNNGLDYIEHTPGINEFGRIVGIAIWENVTEPLNLLKKAQVYLEQVARGKCTITIKAIDLHLADSTIEKFKKGDWIRTIIPSHQINEIYQLKQYVKILDAPEKSIITLGDIDQTNTGNVKENITAITETMTQYYSSLNALKIKANLIDADVAIIKEAYIDKSTVEEEYVKKLYAENTYVKNAAITELNAQIAEINKAKITTAEVETLLAEKGYITELELESLMSDKGYITELETKTLLTEYATIDFANVKVGSITTAMIGVGVVGTTQIADGSITDAKIVELTANKINAGTLSVERLEIRGSNNSIVYALNNITGALQSQNVHTLNGEILTKRTVTADKIVANSITSNEIASKTITANEILADTITSNEIAANTITTKELATDAIKSLNYVPESAGSFLNLADGSFDSKHLKWSNQGALTSTSGIIGGITINENGLSTKVARNDLSLGFDISSNGEISTFKTNHSGSAETTDYRMYLDAENLHLSKNSSGGQILAYSLFLSTLGMSFYDDATNVEIAKVKLNNNIQLELSAPNDVLISNPTTITGALTCNDTLKVSGKSTLARIDASNAYLTGSLYVGGKASTSDGKTGVAFGASGNITLQGSTAPTFNFITGSNKSAQQKIAGNATGIAVGNMRFNGEWLGFYASHSNAINAKSRKGWFGYDGGTVLLFSNEAGTAIGGNYAWSNYSDVRFKKNVEDIPDEYINIWLSLHPKMFEWNELNGNNGKKQFGLIAQDVIEAFDKAGLNHSDYDFVTRMIRRNDGVEYFGLTYEHYNILTAKVVQEIYRKLIKLETKLEITGE